ncbi:hypothetical protein QUF58_08150 [Anaerolineales bacterium HSG24]|nr:hypothetical protein [Anaerolineales bacterium HSG24]
MKVIFNFISGFFWGFFICGGAALVTTPYSGEEFQEQAKNWLDNKSNEWKRLRDEHRSQLEAQLFDLKRGNN